MASEAKKVNVKQKSMKVIMKSILLLLYILSLLITLNLNFTALPEIRTSLDNNVLRLALCLDI